MTIFDLLSKRDQRAALALLRRDPKTVRLHNANGSSVLMGAALFNLADVLDAALAAGADVNETRRDGTTALLFAARAGHAEIVDRLLRAGARHDAPDKAGVTPLMAARKMRWTKVVARLTDVGADAKPRGLLLEAAERGDVRLVRKLLARGSKVDEENPVAETPLLRAARAGHERVVEVLLAHGAELNHRDRKKNTALSNAQAAAHPALVAMLLRHGADPRIRPPRMETLADWAIAYQANEVLDELARRGGTKRRARRAERSLETLSFEETRTFLSSRKVMSRLKPRLTRFEGRALLYRGDLRLRSFRLDHGEYLAGRGTPTMGPGIIIDGSLRIDGAIRNGEQDFGPFLIVLGDLDADSIAVGGSELHVMGDLRVQSAFHGYYNHGSISVEGDVNAALFIADDYTARFGGDVQGTILASYGHVRGALPREPQAETVLAPRFWKRGAEGSKVELNSNAIHDALAVGRQVSRAGSTARGKRWVT